MLQTIDHPNLVKIRTATTVNLGVDYPLVAYELLHGGDLRKYLDVAAPVLSQREILNIGADVASAIEILWLHRIVHRDVKPANVVDAGADRNVLVDVGFCRHIDRSNLTLVGQVAGTPGYMSREQAQGRRNLTIHSDIFSLGVTLYQLASKCHPFQGNQALVGVLKPLPLASHRPDLHPALTQLIDQMLLVVPAQRPSGLAFRLNQLKQI